MKFKKIYLEITNRCNLACNFCLASRRPKGCMTPAFFETVLGQIRPYTDHLALHVLGEPLLHPELGELLDLCQAQALRVNLTTNGTLLPQRLDLLLARPALRQINISLHNQENTGEAEREIYFSGVFSFIRAALDQTSLYINLRLWNRAATGNEPGPPDLLLARLALFFGQQITDELTPGHGISLAPRVFLSIARRFTWPHAPGPDLGGHGFCHGMRSHVAILVDGTVVPCCLDAEADVPLGNIGQQPFAAIIGGERATRIRNGFLRQQVVEPLCRRCSFRQSFGQRPTGGKSIIAA
jgi:radical SAM protein with 4Fe4S-binding SPASM domain